MSIGDFPASLSQAMVVGVMLVERLGVCALYDLHGAAHDALRDGRDARREACCGHG